MKFLLSGAAETTAGDRVEFEPFLFDGTRKESWTKLCLQFADAMKKADQARTERKARAAVTGFEERSVEVTEVES